jgi:hypothetical protein
MGRCSFQGIHPATPVSDVLILFCQRCPDTAPWPRANHGYSLGRIVAVAGHVAVAVAVNDNDDNDDDNNDHVNASAPPPTEQLLA